MSIEIIKNSITNMDTEAVVNAANSRLQEGGGVCGYIFDAAGNRELQEACNKIGHCDTGDAVITPGFKMKSKYIIHAVGPVWEGGNNGEKKLLYGAYYNSLIRAKENDIKSIAFPLISSGIFGYPVDEAWRVAIQAVSVFLNDEKYNIDVKFAILDDSILKKGQSILTQVEEAGYEITRFKPTDKQVGFRGASLKVLPFYNENDKETGVFSNWYKTTFEYAGNTFSSTEQFMMYQKAMVFRDYEVIEKVMKTDSLPEIKALGRSVKPFDEELWSKLSMRIMRQGVRAKFQQNEYCRNILKKSGYRILAEAAPRDKIWGIGLDINDENVQDVTKWQGKNQLGRVLMQVRRDIAIWEKLGIEYIDHKNDPSNEYWEMRFAQLKQIPQVWEIVSVFYDVAIFNVDDEYKIDFDNIKLNELEHAMRYNMGGGIWVGLFYEMKQELYDMVHYSLI